MATRIRDLIYILKQKPDPDEEQRQFNETSKEALWNDNKCGLAIARVLSYICGCTIAAGWFGELLPFPRLLLQFLVVAVIGIVFGGVILAIVSAMFAHSLPLSLPQKLLIAFFVPAFVMIFILYTGRGG